MEDRLEQVYKDVQESSLRLDLIPLVSDEQGKDERYWQVLEVNLEVMVRLPFVQFVSMMCFDVELKRCLDSFLVHRRRDWEGREWNRVDELVFECFHRMVMDEVGMNQLKDFDVDTHRLYISILKRKSVLTCSQVLDIFALYHGSYRSQVQIMGTQLLEMDRDMEEDLVSSLQHAFQVVDLQNLELDEEEAMDNLLDICGMVLSLNVCLGVDRASEMILRIFPSMEDLEQEWACYEHLSNKLGTSHEHGVLLRHGILHLIHLLMFRQLWGPLGLLVGSESFSSSTSDGPGEWRIGLVGQLVQLIEQVAMNLDEVCLGDYEALFHGSKRLRMLLDQGMEMLEYEDRIEYLLQVMRGAGTSLEANELVKAGNLYRGKSIPGLQNPVIQTQNTSEPKKKQRNAKALIKQVQEILPDLGASYIDQLLLVLNDDVQMVVQRVLEGNIPEAVAHLNPFENEPVMEPINRGPQTSTDLFNQLTTARSSPYANNNNGKGKKNDHARDSDQDSDDEEMKAIKARIKQAAALYDEYDDEYDDTYDDHGFEVGDGGQEFGDTIEPIKDGEKTKKKQQEPPKWKPGMVDVDGVKRDINGKEIKEDPDDLLKPNLNRRTVDDNETNNDSDTSNKKKSHGVDGPPTKSTRNRRKFKDKNKAKIANHNRKSGAAKKQARGMF